MGDPTKAREKLGWTPSVTFEELVRRMYEADLKAEQAQLEAGKR
jgi:GDPmannose 4,6-dehydratase